LPDDAECSDPSQLKQYLVELDPHQVTKPVPEWAEMGRKALWSDKDHKRNDNLGRLQTWEAPPKPVADPFALVRFWPCYMEALRPFPKGEDELLKRANEVYHFVAGTTCIEGTYATGTDSTGGMRAEQHQRHTLSRTTSTNIHTTRLS
jgi:hypothetical protein